jgi:hypothetical protein
MSEKNNKFTVFFQLFTLNFQKSLSCNMRKYISYEIIQDYTFRVKENSTGTQH